MSVLTRFCGQELVHYLVSRNLIVGCNTHADTYIKDGEPLSIYEDSDGTFRVEGLHRGVWIDEEITSSDSLKHQLDLRTFIKEVLHLDYFNIPLAKLNCLREGSGAYYICKIKSHNVDLYLTLNNSDTEFALIEKHCKRLSNGVVIIAPENNAPPAYKSVIGNCQYIALDDLFADGHDDEPAPITVYMRSNGYDGSVPITVCPYLELEQIGWGDIEITLKCDHKLTISIKSKDKPYLYEQIRFTRAKVNGETMDLHQTELLKILAYVQVWEQFPTKKHVRLLQRLNDDMQVFFCQKEAFYEKGRDGKYRLRLKLALDSGLTEQFDKLSLEFTDDIESSGLRKSQLASAIPDRDPREAVFDKRAQRCAALVKQLLN